VFNVGIFNGTAVVIILVAIIVVITVITLNIKLLYKEHKKMFIAVSILLVILIAAGAFTWRYVGPAVDKYLQKEVDRHFNEATEPKPDNNPNALPDNHEESTHRTQTIILK
jgi:ABC-type nickel/cobalt efflux system permease component RcnA